MNFLHPPAPPSSAAPTAPSTSHSPSPSTSPSHPREPPTQQPPAPPQRPQPQPHYQSGDNPPRPERQQQQQQQHFVIYNVNQDAAQFEASQRAAAEATARAVQAQHQHIQLQNLLAYANGHPAAMNGMNGAGPAMQGPGVNAGAAMAVGPTPAGHQAELNIIYGLVEELSRQLAENRRQTEDIVSGIGRVRNRAHERGLGNDEVLGEIADDIYAQEPNLEALLSVLTESLDRAKTSRDANFALLTSYARILSGLLSQFHNYKQKHIADVSAWHRSYRSQLAETRAENSRLREQIWEMQEHAGRANKLLREFRKRYDEDEARNDRRIDEKAKKQEIRFWRRMAMPDVPDDDAALWSDDDDLVDPVEKERLKEVERKVAEQQLAGMGSGDSQQGEDSEGEDGPGQGHHGMGFIGGVAMEREGSQPTPPPRPASTGSTGGQAG
ncbi:hypothetical protein JX266_004209 [Neoarthrinium moseri]|uniref:uncharacterized protein n=1 Tax=Neoarthrinium moseri TaxID=1658444 RepID=UPI001FDCC564|nr:uncharacterized protein JN550_007557 [Neoarthrinium moseri]KAI1850351.1 hypothetical protein JX266_004209 [Neoarthrinium moseri]KAI1866704.1 hypothetical protein JN550_007557 [Neoarthrinium moseri]